MDRLTNSIRPYAWGSTTAIPALLGIAPTGEPQAEMWLGAHPGAPSHLDRGPLDAVIAADPERELGPEVVRRHGPQLPFLLKLLAAETPVSLQVHPDLDQARVGHAAEEHAGIPVGDPRRNYRDGNHKPELICALTPFEGFCGFRPPAETADLIAGLGVDSLKPYADLLHAHPEEAALREVLTAVLTADPDAIAETVAETAAAATRIGGPYEPYAGIARHYPGDRGVIGALLLNHMRLQPGEAVYLGAGVPHSYIHGFGVEIMANSDNVLRCGLTPKHVDVPELLGVVRFTSDDLAVLRPEADADGEEVYDTPAAEFRLSRLALAPDGATRDLTSAGPQILLCTAGRVTAGELTLGPGDSVFVPAGDKAEISGADGGPGTLFRATVPA
ncbi:mannose-6-phosphate isomerase, class I [Streptomyces sp. NPDC058953]|uniref:mannose-6-phosphate isomerase, class I n=1 Tax=unclassified Streptomyces TaxID=2593676 RepID=UPI0036D0BF81